MAVPLELAQHGSLLLLDPALVLEEGVYQLDVGLLEACALELEIEPLHVLLASLSILLEQLVDSLESTENIRIVLFAELSVANWGIHV